MGDIYLHSFSVIAWLGEPDATRVDGVRRLSRIKDILSTMAISYAKDRHNLANAQFHAFTDAHPQGLTISNADIPRWLLAGLTAPAVSALYSSDSLVARWQAIRTDLIYTLQNG